MNEMEQQMPEQAPTEAAPMEQEEGTPLDNLISQVNSYIENPAAVTPETLMSLRDQLMDLKSFMDGEDSAEEMSEDDNSSGGAASLMAAMGGRGGM